MGRRFVTFLLLAGGAVAGAAPAQASTAWAPPTELARADKYTAPRAGVLESGDAVVAWTRFGGGSAFATWPPGGPWSDVQTSDESFLRPGLDADAGGTATTIRLTESGVVEARTRPAGQAWEAPVELSTAGVQAGQPAAKVDRSGVVVAVWTEGSTLRSARRRPGQSWEHLDDLAGVSVAGGVDVDVAADGRIAAAWAQDGAAPSSRVAVRPPNGPWAASTVTTTGSGAQIAIDDAGTVTAVYDEPVAADDPHSVVVARSAPAGGAWEAPVVLSRPGTGGSVQDVDAGAVTTAVWVGAAVPSAGSQALMAASRGSAGWERQGDVACAPDGQRIANASIAVASSGATAVAWQHHPDPGFTVRATTGASAPAPGPVCVLAPPSPGPAGEPATSTTQTRDGQTAPQNTAAGQPLARQPVAILRFPAQRLSGVRRLGLVRATCAPPGAGTCTLTLTVSRATARRLGLRARARRVRISRATVTVGPTGSRTVAFRLPRTAVRRLRHLRELRLVVSAKAATSAGTRTSTLALVLR